jgi:hypothetical protein
MEMYFNVYNEHIVINIHFENVASSYKGVIQTVEETQCMLPICKLIWLHYK